MKLSQIYPNTGQIPGVPANPRTITEEDMAALKKSIKNFRKMMYLRPIVVDENSVILGGNQRYQALKLLAQEGAQTGDYTFTEEIPDEWVVMAEDLSPEEKMRFIIEDNDERGQWDYDKLANEWEQKKLKEWDAPVANWQAPESFKPTGQESQEAEPEAQRIIIVYPRDKKEALEAFLGISIEKPRYTYEELATAEK